MMVYKNDKSLLDNIATVTMWLSLTAITIPISLGIIDHLRGFHIGDKVAITLNGTPTGEVGTIANTYEYNNYHETNTHTGYLVSIKGEDVMFDRPEFVHQYK